MYRFEYGFEGFRGIEYASIESEEVVKALWGHPCKVKLKMNCKDHNLYEIYETPENITYEARVYKES